MDETEAKIKIIKDLLAAFPQVSAADGKTVLASYLTAVEDIYSGYVQEAAKRLLKGYGRAGNVAFAPSPTELAKSSRDLYEAEVERSNRRDQINRQLTQQPRKKRTPAEQARAEKFVAGLVQAFKSSNQTSEPYRLTNLPKHIAEANLEAMAKNPRKPEHVSEELRAKLTGAAK